MLQAGEIRELICAGDCVYLTVAVTCSPWVAPWAVCSLHCYPFCTVISSLEGIISGRLLFLRCLALPLEFCGDNTIFSSTCCAGNAGHTGLTSTFPARQLCPSASFAVCGSDACVTAGTSRHLASQPLASPAELIAPCPSPYSALSTRDLDLQQKWVGWKVFLSLVVLMSCR